MRQKLQKEEDVRTIIEKKGGLIRCPNGLKLIRANVTVVEFA